MNNDNFEIVSIHGVPRSGTSWLGQIFNSHPNVAYRHQPLFSYRFKDQISLRSSREEIKKFLTELYYLESDDFIFDQRAAYKDHLPAFEKYSSPGFLVMKMVRYHHLIQKLIQEMDNIKVIGLIRNPCAVINSWIHAPKEFEEGWDPIEEWRFARKKNRDRIEEYNGYEKWKETALMFLEFEKKYLDRFCLIQYEDLVENPISEVDRIFRFVGLKMEDQVSNFIKISHEFVDDDPYSVFKSTKGKNRWKSELNKNIVNEIVQDIQGTNLTRFYK